MKTAAPFGPTGSVVYERTYSRDKAGGGKESWPDTVQRVAQGNLSLVYGKPNSWSAEVRHEADRLSYYMNQFALLPAGRHLWATGVPGRQYLFNPLASETEIVTRDGIKHIGDVAGQQVEVRDGNGAWVSATFKSFGNQRLRKITWTSGRTEKVIYATDDHGWFISGKKGERRVNTADLVPGMKTPNSANRRGPLPALSPVGVQAGFVFGDGTAYSQGAVAYFCGDKDAGILPYFDGYNATDRGDGVLRTPSMFPRSWKSVPSLKDGSSFLYGWLAGYFAADGSVDENGVASLSSASIDSLRAARDVAAVLGINTRPIRTYRRQGYGNVPSAIHYLTLSGLPEEFFLIEAHRYRASQKRKRLRAVWTVRSVETTDRIETVYCATIATTHSFMLADGLRTSNCHVAGWGRTLSEHYQFSFMRLMEGGGVGANYSGKYTGQYGKPGRKVSVRIICNPGHSDIRELEPALSPTLPKGALPLMVADSREGWAAALMELLDTAMRSGPEATCVYDVSAVRPSGSPLKTFGGTASGPAPFALMMLRTADILNAAYAEGGLTPLHLMEIDHAIAECVVSGGNRRSARMAIVHWNDKHIHDFIKCKQDTGLHWTTNISVEIDDEFLNQLSSPGENHAKAVHSAVCQAALNNGEPGYWNSSLSNEGEIEEVVATNPCGEIGLTQWENCNLGHVNLDWFAGKDEELSEAHRLMTRFLIRATFGDVNDPKQAVKLASQRRIGVGHLGVQGYWAKKGVKYSDIPRHAASELNLLYKIVREEARAYAFQLRIPEPVKVTTVAPTGTIAKLPGVSEGIHPIYARHFERRVRFSLRDPNQVTQVREAEMQGFKVETDVYDQSGQTAVVVYPTEDILVAQVRELGLPDNVVQSADELSVEDMLSVQRLYQRHWADNAVSYTCNIPEGSVTPEELSSILSKFLPDLKGTTLMVDASRPQAPYTRITHEEYLTATATKVEDSTDESCASGACPIR